MRHSFLIKAVVVAMVLFISLAMCAKPANSATEYHYFMPLVKSDTRARTLCIATTIPQQDGACLPTNPGPIVEVPVAGY